MRQSPEELAKVVARELAVRPTSGEARRRRRLSSLPAFRGILSAAVVLALIVPAVEGADWIERVLVERNEAATSSATSTTSPSEVLSLVVDAPDLEGRIVSEPVLSSLPRLRGVGPTGALAFGEAPASTVTSVPTSVTTSSPVTPTTTSTSVAPSTTSTTAAPTTTTTEPTTTTTCRGNSGGNGQGNNCKSA